MVLIHEQVLGVQGIAILGVRKKMFKTFEVVRR